MNETTDKKDEIYLRMRKRANEANKKYYGKTSYAPMHKRPWTEEDDRILMDGAESDLILARVLERSVASIQKRRCMLKKGEVHYGT